MSARARYLNAINSNATPSDKGGSEGVFHSPVSNSSSTRKPNSSGGKLASVDATQYPRRASPLASSMSNDRMNMNRNLEGYELKVNGDRATRSSTLSVSSSNGENMGINRGDDGVNETVGDYSRVSSSAKPQLSNIKQQWDPKRDIPIGKVTNFQLETKNPNLDTSPQLKQLKEQWNVRRDIPRGVVDLNSQRDGDAYKPLSPQVETVKKQWDPKRDIPIGSVSNRKLSIVESKERHEVVQSLVHLHTPHSPTTAATSQS